MKRTDTQYIVQNVMDVVHEISVAINALTLVIAFIPIANAALDSLEQRHAASEEVVQGETE